MGAKLREIEITRFEKKPLLAQQIDGKLVRRIVKIWSNFKISINSTFHLSTIFRFGIVYASYFPE
jgi:hypothetical protein